MIINIKGEKNKKRFVLPLCIIIILIIVLVLLNTFKNKKVEKINYYYVALAKLEDKLVNTLDNNQYNNIIGNLSVSLDINNSKFKDIINLINNMDLSYDLILNEEAKNLTIWYEGTYQDSPLPKMQFNLINSDAYLNLGTYYDKDILLETKLANFWSIKSNLKAIFQELIKISKNNLKEEYFQEEKDDNLTDYQLILNKDELNTYIKNCLDNILYNNNLLSSIASLMQTDLNTVRDYALKLQNNWQPFNNGLEINLYINKDGKLEKIVVKGIKDIQLIRNKDNYNIILDKKDIGSINIKDGFNFELNINKNIINIEHTLNKQDGNLKVDIKTNKFKIFITTNYQLKNTDYPKLTIDNYIKEAMLTEKEINNILANINNDKAGNIFLNDLKNLWWQYVLATFTKE